MADVHHVLIVVWAASCSIIVVSIKFYKKSLKGNMTDILVVINH